MGWAKFVSIYCDGCGDAEGTGQTTVPAARDAGVVAGWAFNVGAERDDLCPLCQEMRDQ